jgi:hypothetical protein
MEILALKLDSDAVGIETIDTALKLVLVDRRELTARWNGFPASGTRPRSNAGICA